MEWVNVTNRALILDKDEKCYLTDLVQEYMARYNGDAKSRKYKFANYLNNKLKEEVFGGIQTSGDRPS